MNIDLLKDMLYFCLTTVIVLAALLLSLRINLARLKQKNYFLNRDRERYAETLYASKDGYFAFIYPDERIKDPRRGIRERCSRRLAVMLNLPKGIQSDFADVLDVFYKDDAKKLQKYLSLMQEEHIPFEDTFSLKVSNRGISIFGTRINGADGNLYCDMLWFRDLSNEMLKIRQLEEEKNALNNSLHSLNNLINTLELPIWLRDENLTIVTANKKFLDLFGLNKQQTSYELDKVLFELAQDAQKLNKAQKKSVNLVVNGEARHFEISETPFHKGDNLEKIGTVGTLTDITDLDAVKRHFKIHQTAHLDVLSALGTAFAIFDPRRKLAFYNKSFQNLWNLKPEFLDNGPTFGEFLESVRSSRMLPEVSDFKSYKKEEEKLFDTLIESKEDLLHIPDGRTFRRVIAPHPNGLIFAFEDVSDRLAATRMINELISVQQNILDNNRDAVVIFGADQRLKYFNRSYRHLWKVNEIEMQNLPTLNETLEMQKKFFDNHHWDGLKQNMLNHILNISARFRLERNDRLVVEAIPVILSDESIMITYTVN